MPSDHSWTRDVGGYGYRGSVTYSDLAWINTTGGPIVVLQALHAAAWGGAEDDPDCEDELDGWGDYGTACRVDDRIGLVGYGEPVEGIAPQYKAEFGPDGAPFRALVLGDEPLMSTFVPVHRIALRWYCADSYEHLFATVEAALPQADWTSPLEWEVPPGGLVMMDSAFVLADYENGLWDEERPIPIDLPPGRYRIETAELANATRSAVAIAHRFTPTV